MGANALFWTPGFSLQPSTERPELKQTNKPRSNRSAAVQKAGSRSIIGVHTAPCTGQRWSWHRKEKDWRLLWTALPLIKEALQKDHGRTLNSCQHYFFATVLFHSEINRCQIWSIQELFSLHKSRSSGACALCAADSKSSVRALIPLIFIYEIHLHSIKHFCCSICLISSPASTSLFPLHYLLFLTIFPIIFIFPLERTLWFICDHSYLWHSDEFPPGHGWRLNRLFQRTRPGSR